jgi:GINS complex subunit 4
MDWDDEYELLAAGGGNARPSFIDRVRNAPPDDDDDLDTAARPTVPLIQPDEPETPLEQLMRHWTNERHSPDILPAQEELLGNLLDHLRRQVGLFQLLSTLGDVIQRSDSRSQKRYSYSVEMHQHRKKNIFE